MSPLRCSTIQEALWERAASAGPAPLSPALAEHIAACAACQAESRAVRDLIEIARSIPDPEPPAGVWDGFEEGVLRRIERGGGRIPRIADRLKRHAWKAVGAAAVLALGFGLGAFTMRNREPDPAELAARRQVLLADLQAELRNDAHLESYLDQIEELLAAYQATEHGDAVQTFQQSLPRTMVAGPAVPSAEARERLEQQRAVREQLRSLVLGMLTGEIESESHGFAYLDRRIASIAGQQLLYFVR